MPRAEERCQQDHEIIVLEAASLDLRVGQTRQ